VELDEPAAPGDEGPAARGPCRIRRPSAAGSGPSGGRSGRGEPRMEESGRIGGRCASVASCERRRVGAPPGVPRSEQPRSTYPAGHGRYPPGQRAGALGAGGPAGAGRESLEVRASLRWRPRRSEIAALAGQPASRPEIAAPEATRDQATRRFPRRDPAAYPIAGPANDGHIETEAGGGHPRPYHRHGCRVVCQGEPTGRAMTAARDGRDRLRGARSERRGAGSLGFGIGASTGGQLHTAMPGGPREHTHLLCAFTLV
jgi:hypothetical protein